MEDLPPVSRRPRLPLEVKILPYLLDHRFGNRPVLPAVEAMQLLTASTLRFRADVNARDIANARFDRFLFLEDLRDGGAVVEIANRLDVTPAGSITAVLVTRSRSKKTAITRLKEHVTLQFDVPGAAPVEPPAVATAGELSGRPFAVPAHRLYAELVPFGPAYQTIRGVVQLTEDGALAQIETGIPGAPDQPLGSSFPLDAAFHAACAWGQRFRSIVAFPVGFDRRIVYRPTRAGRRYLGRVRPAVPYSRSDVLEFDLWIYDDEGNCREGVLGLKMRDVSGGRLTPPAWVYAGL
jgi:hypothetical protein